ncbi:hypothetical protein DPMN_063898 [Dreissena polymorpha]|uniref:Uncharacterized protein n=1 Tax=Dreissena polymorpha TaxID=45954 RepID=A0A9D4CBD2_DREPO|nr:hypothetical protein DPMN_063898 [Dreissena polymorpha]
MTGTPCLPLTPYWLQLLQPYPQCLLADVHWIKSSPRSSQLRTNVDTTLEHTQSAGLSLHNCQQTSESNQFSVSTLEPQKQMGLYSTLLTVNMLITCH